MSATARAYIEDAEANMLDRLRERYEKAGFVFKVAPERSELPAFLGDYLPDAVARKPGRNIAIEIKHQNTQTSSIALQDVRSLLETHPDWQLSVVYAGGTAADLVTIATPSRETMLSRIEEVRHLVVQGQKRPALVMAWSLLEAVLHMAEGDMSYDQSGAGTVVQTLAMKGYITPELETGLRQLIPMRNRILHGDGSAEPGLQDVELVLSAVDEVLLAEAA